ncbi:type I-C CRISPR-associated protein Cas8c/Csd1 [Caballeronia telluris]|uniref:CRISPR-associated protein (Cas_Csd1) n=1 Tax=Caballeronia telluris TaxID=326475 RepID=A0A158J961_9BURK|nr:type I-C CRISPR-associated protein Cas8c/Csd1 [Caballeronia telluris]SAL65023.1 CRISPR-associated protein (Cas_Csd1) [Caballeronia telluris]
MIFSALAQHYDRQAKRGKLPAFGLSQEKISFALLLAKDGTLVDVDDIRDHEGKRPKWKLLTVPASFKRPGISPAPFFLWDKTAFVLGVEQKAGSGAPALNLKSHGAFKALHLERLADATDEGLVALRKFLEAWVPEKWSEFPAIVKHVPELFASNVVFRLDGVAGYIHESAAANELVARHGADDDSPTAMCLVTGDARPIARLHPAIKGVWGAQVAGASILSFHVDCSKSYGKENGANAPVSTSAAFGYTTVLNHLLQRDPHHRQCVQIGDASVVFWAEANDESAQEAAESLFLDILDPPPPTDSSETANLRHALEAVSQGRALDTLDTRLDPKTKMFVLGLSPNASRLSIRYWATASLEEFAKRLAQHYDDLLIEPVPWKTPPAAWRLLAATAAQEKSENIPPQLAGAMMRAVLTGSRYPRSLLSAAIVRMRADKDVSGLRVALCKAVLARDLRLNVKGIATEIPVSLNRNDPTPSYRLGRLFSVLESIQNAALGDKLNATIRDRYYGSASATPVLVFPLLMRGAQNHLSKAMTTPETRGRAISLEREAGEILDGMGSHFPRTLSLEDQGCFAIGYYHQRSERFRRKSDHNDASGVTDDHTDPITEETTA